MPYPSMKPLAPLLLLLVASCGTTRIMAVGGKSDLGNDVNPMEDQTVAGLEVSSGPPGGGLGFEVGARYGRDTGSEGGIDYLGETYEYYAGPRYEWRWGDWSPFVSAGLTLLHGRGHSTIPEKYEETDLGYYGAVGVDYHFGDGWHLGGSIRKTDDHDGSYAGTEGDADAWQYLLRFGWAF